MQLPPDLFNPRHYQEVRKPLLQAETMPTWCYTSDAFYQREVERIWRKAWNFLGHVDQVARPGDYVSLEFAGVPLIIVRGKDMKIRAFANACPFGTTWFASPQCLASAASIQRPVMRNSTAT